MEITNRMFLLMISFEMEVSDDKLIQQNSIDKYL